MLAVLVVTSGTVSHAQTGKALLREARRDIDALRFENTEHARDLVNSRRDSS